MAEVSAIQAWLTQKGKEQVVAGLGFASLDHTEVIQSQSESVGTAPTASATKNHWGEGSWDCLLSDQTAPVGMLARPPLQT